MPVKEPLPQEKSLFVDRRALMEALAEFHAATGFVPDDTGTIEDLHQQMIAEGVRPEENIFSREMIALRYPDEE